MRLIPLFAAVLPLASAAQAPMLDLQPIKATERVYYVQATPGMAARENQGFNSNAAFAITDAGVAVFDAPGTPALGAAVRRAIANVTAQPIRRVIVSHFHADNFSGLQSLKALTSERTSPER